MAPRTFPFMLLAAGVVAASMLSRNSSGSVKKRAATEEHNEPRRFRVERDVPSLGLRRGEMVRVEPEALIHQGDVVALRSVDPELVLTRFHDELMHCTAGLVVREAQPVPVV